MKRVARWLGVLGLVLLVGLQTACTDQKDQAARDRIVELKDMLVDYSQDVHAWQTRVHDALCQLDRNIWTMTGNQAPDVDAMYCRPGGPEPEDPPEPLEDPWAVS